MTMNDNERIINDARTLRTNSIKKIYEGLVSLSSANDILTQFGSFNDAMSVRGEKKQIKHMMKQVKKM